MNKLEEYISIFVNEYEERENVYKIFLSASINDINLNPWTFLPKLQVAEIKELEEDDERGKYCFISEKWIWDVLLNGIIESQLICSNDDTENEISKDDFKLNTTIVGLSFNIH